MEAGTLNCPSCGAAISNDSTLCQYCGSLLQTVACPSCFGLMFLGSKFCPHCGKTAQALMPEGKSHHTCPRCQAGLQVVRLNNTPLEECPHCSGLWIKCSTFEQICSAREAQTAAIGLALPPPLQAEKQVFYIKCPECGQMMNRMNYAHSSGIVIDMCRPHGIWFDRDELRRVVEFIRAGGLDHEREIEKEALESERRRLEAQQQTGSGLGMASPISLGSGHASDADDVLCGVASVLKWLVK